MSINILRKIIKTESVFIKLSLVALIVFPSFVSGQITLAQEEGYVWVLVNEVDDRGIDDLNKIEARLKNYEKSGITSSLNNTGYYVDYAVQKTFVGMNSAAQATISTAPLEIKSEAPIPLNIRVSVTENEGYKGEAGDAGASARVVFCGENSTPGNFVAPTLNGKTFYGNEFKSESGESLFDSNSINGYQAHNIVVSGSLPAGTKHGEAIAVCAEVSLVGVTMGTVYKYLWLPAGSGEMSGHNKKYEVPKDENGDYIDSGVRVSEISGEVYVRRGDASGVEWEMLNLDDVIYEGDIVYTKDRNSRCSLSLTDLTTFEMRPRTDIIINTRSEKESALSILAGKVIVNVKKMIKDGSMNVEMSQCIAGARGTIFVLEGDDKSSRVAVLEGRVEVKANDGSVTMLNPNEKIVIIEGKTEEKEAFSLRDELNDWEEETRKKILADIEERTGQAPNMEAVPVSGSINSSVELGSSALDEKKRPLYLYLSVIAILFSAGIGFRIKKRKSI